MAPPKDFQISCPASFPVAGEVRLAHGGGGRLSRELIEKVFLPRFNNPALAARHDGAVVQVGSARLALTTDSYVVHPLFFPGGDIGSLAVNGTVNDLAMCGARPLFLSAGFILEEGLPMETLQRVAASMQQAAERSGVQLVTGDTKVVDRGKADGLFINTAGIGELIKEGIGPAGVRPDDVILLNGDLGRHGMAVMAAREGLSFESAIESDSQPLADLVVQLLEGGVDVRCLRDLTRGGLSSALNEIADSANVSLDVRESAIPVREDVQGACEILGLDPLYVANEGRFIAFVPPQQAERALGIMRRHPSGQGSCQVGRVVSGNGSGVTLETRLGTRRILDMLSGEQLPRIC